MSKQTNILIGLFTIAISLLVLSLFTTLVVREFNHRKQQKNVIQVDDICLSASCVKAANHLLQRIDKTVDPCEDFYAFSCGTWMKNTKILNGQHVESALHQINTRIIKNINELLSLSSSDEVNEPNFMKNTRRLYDSCVDENRIEMNNYTTKRFLIRTGFSKFLVNRTSNLLDMLLKLNEYNTFFFYHVETDVDEKNTEQSIYRIEMSPGRLLDVVGNFLIPFESYLTSNDGPEINITRLQTTANFSKQIAVNLWSPKDEAYYESEDLLTTVKNLSQALNTTFDFSTYIRRLYKQANINLADDIPVAIYKLESIRNIVSIIDNTSWDTILDYATTHFVAPQYFHMPVRYRIKADFLQQPMSIYSKETRAIQCAKFVFKHMKLAVSRLYNDNYHDKFELVEVIDMMKNIQNEFVKMINQSIWMDPISKKRTIEKAYAIVDRIGYPGFLINDNITILEDFYKEHLFNSSHMENALLLLQLNAERNLKKIHQKIFREECCDYDPITANAFYTPFFNEIVIPTTILEPPFYHKDAPKYLNYGAIGSVIGHEITHGFDDTRRHLDKDRKNYTLWSNETTKTYNKRSKCLIDQYNNYLVKQINRTINGTQTVNENIADNDGLKKAYFAYQTWLKNHQTIEKKLPGLTDYSSEQLFFISYAQLWCTKMTNKYAAYRVLSDVHSPSEFRVLGSTSNLAAFDKAFRCRSGQRNSRVDKCSVW